VGMRKNGRGKREKERTSVFTLCAPAEALLFVPFCYRILSRCRWRARELGSSRLPVCTLISFSDVLTPFLLICIVSVVLVNG